MQQRCEIERYKFERQKVESMVSTKLSLPQTLPVAFKLPIMLFDDQRKLAILMRREDGFIGTILDGISTCAHTTRQISRVVLTGYKIIDEPENIIIVISEGIFDETQIPLDSASRSKMGFSFNYSRIFPKELTYEELIHDIIVKPLTTQMTYYPPNRAYREVYISFAVPPTTKANIDLLRANLELIKTKIEKLTIKFYSYTQFESCGFLKNGNKILFFVLLYGEPPRIEYSPNQSKASSPKKYLDDSMVRLFISGLRKYLKYDPLTGKHSASLDLSSLTKGKIATLDANIKKVTSEIEEIITRPFPPMKLHDCYFIDKEVRPKFVVILTQKTEASSEAPL